MSNNSSQLFSLEDFKKSISRLAEVLRLKKTSIIRDSAIKRFELCFDLAWKTIKLYAKKQGVVCYSPRGCFKAAFQLKLIEHNKKWFKMLDDRNLTAYLYKEKQADQVYHRLSDYLLLFKKLVKKLEEIKES